MKIAIASDLHENYKHKEWFIDECTKRGISRVLFLGDAINPGLISQLATSGLSLHFVWGNNDGDAVKTVKILLENNHSVSDYCFDELSEDGKKVFVTHYPLLGENAAKSGKYDAVFYGHNHQKHEEHVDKTLLVNPGELSGHLSGTVSFYVWDTELNTGEFILHPNPQPAI